MTRFNVFACCLLALVTTSSRAESPNSSREKTASVEDFEKLQSQFAGRWIGELKVNVLWPKSGLKEGDVADVYADFNVDLDGMTLTGEHKLGHIKWKQTFHYDATKSAIIANWSSCQLHLEAFASTPLDNRFTDELEAITELLCTIST